MCPGATACSGYRSCMHAWFPRRKMHSVSTMGKNERWTYVCTGAHGGGTHVSAYVQPLGRIKVQLKGTKLRRGIYGLAGLRRLRGVYAPGWV